MSSKYDNFKFEVGQKFIRDSKIPIVVIEVGNQFVRVRPFNVIYKEWLSEYSKFYLREKLKDGTLRGLTKLEEVLYGV